MNSNLKLQNMLPIEKKNRLHKTRLIVKVISRKGGEKNRLILKHPKNQTPAKRVSLVKRINEGHSSCFICFCFYFLSKQNSFQNISSAILQNTSVSSNLKLIIKNVTGRIRNRQYMIFGLFGQLSSIWNGATKHKDLIVKNQKKNQTACFLRSLYKDLKNV